MNTHTGLKSTGRHLAMVMASIAGGAIAGGAVAFALSSQVVLTVGPVATVISPTASSIVSPVAVSPSPLPSIKAPAPLKVPVKAPAPVRIAAPATADPTAAPAAPAAPAPVPQLNLVQVQTDGGSHTIGTYTQAADFSRINWTFACSEGTVTISIEGPTSLTLISKPQAVDRNNGSSNGFRTYDTAPGSYSVIVTNSYSLAQCSWDVAVQA